MKLNALFAAALVGVAFTTSSVTAWGVAVDGQAIIATGGNVIATYLGTTASYTDDLYLYSPTNGLGLIFRNQTSAVGSTVDLGNFVAGTELVFQLYVVNTGYSFYSGAPSRNPDGLAHARVDDAYAPGLTLVQFEDLYGTPEGASGFNDLSFTFSNVRSESTSVPDGGSTLALLGSSFSGLAMVARRYRK